MTPLRSAVSASNWHEVSRLTIEGIPKKESDIILHAARYASPAIISLLARAGAKINSHNSDMYAPLHVAVEYNTLAACDRLIKLGADVNAQTSIGSTPLSVAITVKAPMDIIKLLLDHGASISTRDADGWTPLHCAIASHHYEAAEILIDMGADIDAQDFNSGASPASMFPLFNSSISV